MNIRREIIGAIGGVFLGLMGGVMACRSTQPSSPPASTVRFLDVRCSKCSIESSARALAGATAEDCSETHGREGIEAVVACVKRADAEGRPFLATLMLPGVDSAITVGLVRAPDGTLSRLWYDSDGSGGTMPCNASVSATPCARLALDPEHPENLDCEPGGERRSLCAERDTRVTSLGPVERTDDLRCGDIGDFIDCIRVPGAGGQGIPPGTALVCRPFGRSKDFNMCTRDFDGRQVLGLPLSDAAPPADAGAFPEREEQRSR